MALKGLLALSSGTLVFGIAEFVAMGLLPYVAADFGLSLDTAGQIISLYALGVVTGSLSLPFVHNLPLRKMLLGYVVLMIIGNALTALADSFTLLLGARFIAGLPHGCFFGIGSIIAQRLAGHNKGGLAVAIMVMGMTVANVVGVPLGTTLAHHFSWRLIFFLLTAWCLLVLAAVFRFIPEVGKAEDGGFKAQFAFLAHEAPWLVLLATFCGNAGIFCLMSYISPLLTELSGLPLTAVPVVLILMGLCMVLANLMGGRLGDKYGTGYCGVWFQTLAVLSLTGVVVAGSYPVVMIILSCLCAGSLFALGTVEQVSILRTAPGGLLLGASLIQVFFNAGNALGAYVGGLPLLFDWPLPAIPALGAGIALTGLVALIRFYLIFEKKAKAVTGGEHA